MITRIPCEDIGPRLEGRGTKDIRALGLWDPMEAKTEGDDCLDDQAPFRERGAAGFSVFDAIGVETTDYFCILVMKVENVVACLG